MAWLLLACAVCVTIVTTFAAPAQSDDNSESSQKRFSTDDSSHSLQSHPDGDEMVNWKTIFHKRRFPGLNGHFSEKQLGNSLDDGQMVNWNRLFKKHKRTLDYDADQAFPATDLSDTSMVNWNDMFTKRGFHHWTPSGSLAEQEGPDMVDWNSIYKGKRGLLRTGSSLSNSPGGMDDPSMVDWTKMYKKRNFGGSHAGGLNDPNMVNWDALYGFNKRQLPAGNDQYFNSGWRPRNMVNWDKVFSKRLMDKRRFGNGDNLGMGTEHGDFQNWGTFQRKTKAFDDDAQPRFGLNTDLKPKQLANWSTSFKKRRNMQNAMPDVDGHLNP